MADFKVKKRAIFPGGETAQIVAPAGVRVNTLVGDSSSAATDLPNDSKLIAVRATDAVWLRFGTSSMGAAAADANSILFVGGEAVMFVPETSPGVYATHYRALRVGSADVYLQIERVD